MPTKIEIKNETPEQRKTRLAYKRNWYNNNKVKTLTPANKAWVTMRKNNAFIEGLSTVMKQIAEHLKEGLTPIELNKKFRPAYVTMVVRKAKEQGVKLKGLVEEPKPVVEVKKKRTAYNPDDKNYQIAKNKEIVRNEFVRHCAAKETPANGVIFDMCGPEFGTTMKILAVDKFAQRIVEGVEFSQAQRDKQEEFLAKHPSLRNKVAVLPITANEYMEYAHKTKKSFAIVGGDLCSTYSGNKELIDRMLNLYMHIGSVVQFTVAARNGKKKEDGKKSEGELLREAIVKTGLYKFERIEGLSPRSYGINTPKGKGKGTLDMPCYKDTQAMYTCVLRRIK